MLPRPRYKRAMTYVEIMVVVSIIGILLSIAARAWLRSRQQARAKACIENQQKMYDSVQRWAMDTGAKVDSTPTYPEIVGKTLYLKRTPICPIGPTPIGIPTVNNRPVCPTNTVDHDLMK